MIVMHPYSPEPSQAQRQEQTWAALARMEDSLPGTRFVHVPCGDDDAYEASLKRLWAQDDLVVVEHDIVPTAGMILSLTGCREDVCAQQYRLHYANRTLEALHWVRDRKGQIGQEGWERILGAGIDVDALVGQWDERTGEMRDGCWEPLCHRVIEADGSVRWGRPEDQWADLVGLGLTRLSKRWMADHPPEWKAGRWSDLDGRISIWMHASGQRAHLHRPEARHMHPCRQGSWVGDMAGFAALDGPLPAWPDSPDPEPMPPADQIPEEAEAFLERVGRTEPGIALEIGVRAGGMLARIASRCGPHATVIGVDLVPPERIPLRPGQVYIPVAGDSHADATRSRVEEILRGRKAGLLFIDGDHFGAYQDYRDYSPMVQAGGIVAFHDIHPGPVRLVGTVPGDWLAIRPHDHEEIVSDRSRPGFGIGWFTKGDDR
jgi:hypothetical protein